MDKKKVLDDGLNEVADTFIEMYKSKQITRGYIDTYIKGTKDGLVVALGLIPGKVKDLSLKENIESPYSSYVYNQTVLEVTRQVSEDIETISKKYDSLIDSMDAIDADRNLKGMMKSWSEEDLELNLEEEEEDDSKEK